MKRLVLATMAVALALGMASIASADHEHDRFSQYSKHGYAGYPRQSHSGFAAYGDYGASGRSPHFSSYGAYGPSPYGSYDRGYTVPRNPWPAPPPYGHHVGRAPFVPPFPLPTPGCAAPRSGLSLWFGF